MRITFVLPTVNMSGGIRVVAIYAQWLKQQGHQIFLISQPPARPHWKQQVRGLLKGQGLPPPPQRPGSHLDRLDVPHVMLPVQRPVLDADVPDADVIIATWWETAEWVAALSPRKGAKVYFVQHHEVFDWLPQARCRGSYRLPLHKIVVARWLQDVMAQDYGDTEVDLVPNGVDPVQFHAPVRGKQARPTVGFLYSHADFKGVDITLAAVAQLRQHLPELRAVSFGMDVPPPELGLDFVFNPAQDSIRDLYAACDVWLTASRSEGFNLPAMEAMACRTPVISTRTGWPEEAIHDGMNGYLVDINDATTLAQRAAQVLSLPDADWRAMSAAAYATVQDKDWPSCARLFEQALLRRCQQVPH
jgi:glycosyltransferase involved in cell wall biosynthesis